MKLNELVEDVMNLDIKKESMDDNHGHICYFIFVKLSYFEFGLKCKELIF